MFLLIPTLARKYIKKIEFKQRNVCFYFLTILYFVGAIWGVKVYFLSRYVALLSIFLFFNALYNYSLTLEFSSYLECQYHTERRIYKHQTQNSNLISSFWYGSDPRSYPGSSADQTGMVTARLSANLFHNYIYMFVGFRDNDRSSLNCASMLKGGWWWKSCGRGLNGLYLHDPQDLTARQGNI